MDDEKRIRLDAFIEILAEEVSRKLAARTRAASPAETMPAQAIEQRFSTEVPSPNVSITPSARAAEPPIAAGVSSPDTERPSKLDPAAHMRDHIIGRLVFAILAIVVLINIPLNGQGMALARSVPNSASLALRNGLLVKELGSLDVWVYRNGGFRWITSLDAFARYGYRWQNVHIVEDGYLNSQKKGSPLYVLEKCDGSPHVFGFQPGQKHWIVDIPTFKSEGYVWSDVKIVPCTELQRIPDGESIPPGYGSPAVFP